MSTTDSPPPTPPPPPPPPTDSGPRISGPEARDLGRLRRTTKASPERRHLAGVAGGLARHFDIDPVIVRVLMVVLVFFGGAGLILYGAGWLLVPEEGERQAAVPLDERNRSLALYVAGGVAALALIRDAVDGFHFPWPLAIIALVLLVLLGSRDRVKDADRGTFAGPATDPDVSPGGGTPAGPPAPYDDPAGTTAGTTATAGWVAPPTYGPPSYGPTYVPQPNPRKRGPILFWFTLALIALGLGVLGMVDAAGARVADSAYPALALGITGAMLVLGAFWGRAGGLILVGLLATVGLVATTANHEFGNEDHRIHAAPTSAAAVRDEYRIDAGELVVDLTHVSDPSALDGRTISVRGGVGRLSVVVPDDWGVRADTSVGVGNTRVLDGDEVGGFGISRGGSESGEPGAPTLSVDVNLGVGTIQVVRESAFPWPGHDFSGWSTR